MLAQFFLQYIRQRSDLRAGVVSDDGFLAHKLLQLTQTQLLLPQLIRDLLRQARITLESELGHAQVLEMEEATLRAKIQAMKNLLEAKRQSSSTAVPAATYYNYPRPNYGYYQPRKHAVSSGPVNRSWNRFSPTTTSTNRSLMNGGSANKVWRREDAPTSTPAQPVVVTPSVSMNKAWKRPMKVTGNKSKSMQLQVLRLEDGEYAKANGGFSLVRAGVKKPAPSAAVAKPMPVTRTNSSVHIGGVKYVVANGGKVLKRCATEEHKSSAVYKPGSMSLTTKSGAARAALIRAKVTMQRARNKRFRTKKLVKVRTVYCSFYNRFGKYLTVTRDALVIRRRVTMCRKFLKNECNDPKCLLSHQHDENKIPDCRMFLRGACTREGCKYRHVKVSATADLCKPFTMGFCPKGAACPLRHELPQASRNSSTTASVQNTNSKSTTASGTTASPASSGPALPSSRPMNDNAELSIRPNIRFASKHTTGFPSLFDGLRREAK
ncbi:Zinc finger CCCH domain-containing protein 3 [Phytophthora citrophthora]|uniref:Zinc finger CCCH domain-containing protein 3 n=1 Tax=Phytophthora citrophthora TaxID=4793 RepID=A0AAD9H118_9STRA|nr:Zinc finger CCCH domain-containing protein 3 [Phytophthora citrophthora]